MSDSEIPIGHQAIAIIRADGAPIDIPIFDIVSGGVGKIRVPDDGEEHVFRNDGERLYFDGQIIPLTPPGPPPKGILG